MKLSETQSRAALNASSNALQLAQRQWISAEFSITNKVSLSGTVVSLQYGVTYRNTGHSPAIDVEKTSRFMAWDPGTPNPELSNCLTQKPDLSTLGWSIFPEQVHEEIPHTELSAELGPPFPLHRGDDTRRGDRMLVINTCISYRFSFSPELHHTFYTNYIGEISKADGSIGVILVTNDTPGKYDLLAPLGSAPRDPQIIWGSQYAD